MGKEVTKFKRMFVFALVAWSFSQVVACRFADENKMKAKYGKTKIVEIPAGVELSNEEFVKGIELVPVPFEVIYPEKFHYEMKGSLPTVKGANEYNIEITFHEGKREVLQVEAMMGGVQHPSLTIPVSQTVVHIPILGGEKFSLIVKKLSDGESIPIFSVAEGIAPEDLIVNGVLPLDHKMIKAFGRILFTRESKLVTNGNDLIVTAKYLEAQDDSYIETFDFLKTAPPGSDGRNGGNIKLEINSALGSLTISGIGEHGGDGAKGAKHNPLKAANGHDGKDAKETCVGFLPRVCKCDANAKSGTNGKDGLPGNKGQNGGNGGNSAIVKVSVKENSNFDVNVLTSGGFKGMGGAGGPPQIGGEPGNRGKGNSSCDNPGSNGKRGDTPKTDGPSGDNGKDGYRFEPCIRIGERPSSC